MIIYSYYPTRYTMLASNKPFFTFAHDVLQNYVSTCLFRFQTVFEMSSTSKNQASAIMKNKRSLHGNVIQANIR